MLTPPVVQVMTSFRRRWTSLRQDHGKGGIFRACHQPASYLLQRGAMGADTYRTKCLPSLLKFPPDNCRDRKMSFCPDLAPAHC